MGQSKSWELLWGELQVQRQVQGQTPIHIRAGPPQLAWIQSHPHVVLHM